MKRLIWPLMLAAAFGVLRWAVRNNPGVVRRAQLDYDSVQAISLLDDDPEELAVRTIGLGIQELGRAANGTDREAVIPAKHQREAAAIERAVRGPP